MRSTVFLELKSLGDTRRLAQALIQVWPEVRTIALQGDLGAGKTTLVQQVLAQLGVQGPVKSPTYTLVESYQTSQGAVHHFDLYRLGDPEELYFMGIEDYLKPDAHCMIEWPEKGEGVLPGFDLALYLSVKPSGRMVAVTGRVAERVQGGFQS